MGTASGGAGAPGGRGQPAERGWSCSRTPRDPAPGNGDRRAPQAPGPGPNLGPFPRLLTGCSASCD